MQHEDVAARTSNWVVRVHSVDVFSDKTMRVNIIFTNTGRDTYQVAISDLRQVQLVADGSDERVTARGRPEGVSTFATASSFPGYQFAPNDPVRIAFRFPAFQDETKTARLVIYSAAYVHGYSMLPDVIIRNIALFAKP